MKNRTIFPACLALAWAWGATAWAENRLSATMGEVILRNLQPGATYHLTSLLSFPLKLTYLSDKPAQVAVQPALPEAMEGKEGYEPVPDLGWVGLDPSHFSVQGSSVMECNVTIAVPEDESLRGRKFIVYLWSQTMGESKGLSLGLGAKSRLLISVAKEKSKAAPDGAPAKSYMDFELDPAAVQLKAAVPGRRRALRNRAGGNLLLRNTGAEDQRFRLEIVRADSLDMSPPRDGQWGPEKTEFKISPRELKVRRGRQKKFSVRIKIPDDPQHYGKRYHYLLRATPEGVGMSSGILFRIGVETASAK